MTAEKRLEKLIEAVQLVVDQIPGMKCWNSDDELHLTGIRDDLEDALFEAQKPSGKEKGYELSYDTDGVATCKVLHREMGAYYNDHKDKYPVPMYTDFLRYWSMPNSKGVPAWYTEKTKVRGRFHLPGRLATWAKNQKERERNKVPEKVPVAAIPDRLKTRLV